jgi:type II pantothenate kinase
MLVGDIYGGDYNKFGLDAGTVACSFGKMMNSKSKDTFSKADIARALLVMITNNIGQVNTPPEPH